MVAYVVVFRHDLYTAVDRGVERTRLSWRERLVRMVLVDVATVVALLVAVTLFLVADDVEVDDPFTAAILAFGAAGVVVAAVAWSSALRLAVNIAGRVDEFRREATTRGAGVATRRAGPGE